SGYEELGRRRPADPARRRGRGGSVALRNEPARSHHDQRHRLPGGAPPEPGDRARLRADDTRGNAGAPPALRVLCRGRALGTVQIDQEVRRRGRPRAARLSAAGTAPALETMIHHESKFLRSTAPQARISAQNLTAGENEPQIRVFPILQSLYQPY